MNNLKNNVAVLFGGKSPEHEVSIITGVQVLNKIDKTKYNPIPIYISKEGRWFYSEDFFDMETFKDLEAISFTAREVTFSTNPQEKEIVGTKKGLFGKRFKLEVDVIFPCFHGSSGEDGAFQGLFEIAEIPYVGTEVVGSAICMDKVVTKDILRANGIPTAPYTYYSRAVLQKNLDFVIDELESKFKYPMFTKPAVGGSSVGITRAKNREELKNGLELASLFDSKVLVEEGIEGAKEINISVIGSSTGDVEVSVSEEVFHKGDFLNYDDKYKGDDGKSKGMVSAKRKIPAEIDPSVLSLVEDVAKKAFYCLNCFGLVRIDFLITENPKEVKIIEVNTIPGSMAFYLWQASGVSFTELIGRLIELAKVRHREKASSTVTFSSNILKDFKAGIKNSKVGQ